jgi:hypothetical protein
MPYKDPEKRREASRKYNREFREKNPDYQREYRRKHPEYHRDRQRLTKYGLTRDDYLALLEKQGGVCASCGREDTGNHRQPELHVDHDHDTGLVRGLLCHNCNLGLGKLGDNIAGVKNALAYLERHYSSTEQLCPERDSSASTTPAQGARVQMELLPE